MLGDLGGVTRVLLSFFGIIFYPISRFLFIINSAQSLYLARTKDDNLLRKSLKPDSSKLEKKIMSYTDGSKIPCKYNDKMMNELQKHRMILITN